MKENVRTAAVNRPQAILDVAALRRGGRRFARLFSAEGTLTVSSTTFERHHAVARHYRVLLPTTANAFEDQLASVASVRLRVKRYFDCRCKTPHARWDSQR